ncbi:hypothetical protein SAMN05428981_103410 [Bacillus sp. OV194]|nr:hypothetical protein SAMN05428981_103410 [Bacillus sp. OV194]
MLDINYSSSKKFKEILHSLLESVVDFFIEIGSSPVEYEDIYATVFPAHKQSDKEANLKILKNLYMHIVDDFVHPFPPLHEYVLFHILKYVHEGTEESFILTDNVNKMLSQKDASCFDIDELKLLKIIKTPIDLIGIIFEDSDFLDVAMYVEIYKTNPDFVTNVMYIDLEYYSELMPDDILDEFKQIKHQKVTEMVEKTLKKRKL